jgi:excinuclease UvrABC nuclease subunit
VSDVNLSDVFQESVELPAPPEPVVFKSIPAHGGVCAFADEQGQLIQALSGQSLRRLVRTRLEPPEETTGRRADLRAITRCIWWTRADSVFETTWQYLQIARRLHPTDYLDRVAFKPAWFARALLDDDHPRWVLDRYALDGKAVDVGPFTTRREAARFTALLEDLFDLCRYPDMLRQAPHGTACLYYEMGRCAAPCDGSQPMSDYQETVVKSLDVAINRGGAGEAWTRAETEHMRSAAVAQAFEAANRVKKALDDWRKQRTAPGWLAPTPDRLRFLIIQRGATRQTLKIFLAAEGTIGLYESLAVSEVDGVHVEAWRAALAAISPPLPSYAEHASENFWLLSHFAARHEKNPGLFLTPDELEDTPAAAQKIIDHFSSSANS